MVNILIFNEMGQQVAVGVTEEQINAPALHVANLEPANAILNGVDYQVRADHDPDQFIVRTCIAVDHDAATATFR